MSTIFTKAVLVAIAIPIFTSQFEKSRDATSVSNIRSAYAEASAKLLTWDGKATTFDNANIASITKDASGDITVTVQNVAIKSQKSTPAWNNQASELPISNAATLTDPGTAGTYKAAFKFPSDNGKPELTLMAQA